MMQRRRKLYWAKMSVVMGAFSVLLWAYEYGPNPGVCGVPGENGTCTQLGCHAGTTNDPNNKGSLAIGFPNGQTYVPGVSQHLTVTIYDPAPTQQAWGFEVTARQSSNSATMTGTFSPSDQYTQIMCSQAPAFTANAYCLPGANPNGNGTLSGCFPSSAPACPANLPLQYMEHSVAGYSHTMGLVRGTYQFDWTPPSTNVGNITFYLAGNAGVGGAPNQNGDHIYATTFTLAPSSANPPTVTSVASNPTGLAGIGPNLYVNINGANLSSTTEVWDSFITNNTLPTQLGGVSVSIGGAAAFVEYVSPTRIQVLTPPDLGLGTVAVQVTNSNGTSASVSVTSQQFAPGFFEWLNNQPVATHADFSDAMKNGTYAGLTTVPAKPGEYIILWGSGFGPTTPPTPNGTVVPNSSTPYSVTSDPSLTLNGQPMTYYATVLAPTFAGLYQVIAQVPSSIADGDWPVIATVGSISSPTGVVLTVHN